MKFRGKRTLLLALAIGTSFAAGVYASDGIQRVDAYLRPDFKVVTNGDSKAVSSTPLIYNDQTYLPLRDLAGVLDSTVSWDGPTKTIYVSKRLSGGTVKDLPDVYKEITMINPGTYEATYLGTKYYLFSFTSKEDYKTYYRVRDLIDMGVDVTGLTKAKEKYSGMLMVEESEAKKAFKQSPKMMMTQYPPVYGVTDKTDKDDDGVSDLEEALLDIAKNQIQYLVTNDGKKVYVRIFDIEPVPNKPNYYFMMGYEANKYETVRLYLFEMKQQSDQSWYTVTFQTGNLTDFDKFMDPLN